MLIPKNLLLLCVIASAHAEMEGFIVGGQYANIDHHPYSAFLNIDCATSSGQSAWVCGASIVNQRILLTAGHCLYKCNNNSHIGVIIGSENTERGKEFTTYSFIVHENYNPDTSINDICLVKVHSPLSLNKKVARVALMRKPPYSELARVAGWGMIDEIKEKRSEYLKYVPQKVWEKNACLKLFGYQHPGTLCAAAENMEGYPSSGDSGSALVVRGYIQIGLVSYKIPHKSREVIIYTDIGYFYNWIKRNSKRMFCI